MKVVIRLYEKSRKAWMWWWSFRGFLPQRELLCRAEIHHAEFGAANRMECGDRGCVRVPHSLEKSHCLLRLDRARAQDSARQRAAQLEFQSQRENRTWAGRPRHPNQSRETRVPSA